MKVVHLTSVHDWRDPRIMEKMLPSVCLAGYEAVLITLGDAPDANNGVTIISAGSRSSRISNARRVCGAAGSVGADVYHLHDPELLPFSRRLKKAGAAVVYDVHEDYRSKGPGLGRLIRAVEKWAFRWLDAVTLAEESYKDFTADARLSEEILNYHNISRTQKAPRELDPSVPAKLVYTGIVSEQRGLFSMLELASLASEQGLEFELHIAGICHSDVERREAEAIIRDAGLNNIHITGWEEYLPQERILTVQSVADVGLALLQPHPNYTKSIPTKFYEYMASGLPILCSDFQAWREFVEANGCGITCDPDDPGAILGEIRALLRDQDRYTRVSAAALEAADRFHWREMESRLLRLYAVVTSE